MGCFLSPKAHRRSHPLHGLGTTVCPYHCAPGFKGEGSPFSMTSCPAILSPNEPKIVTLSRRAGRKGEAAMNGMERTRMYFCSCGFPVGGGVGVGGSFQSIRLKGQGRGGMPPQPAARPPPAPLGVGHRHCHSFSIHSFFSPPPHPSLLPPLTPSPALLKQLHFPRQHQKNKNKNGKPHKGLVSVK